MLLITWGSVWLSVVELDSIKVENEVKTTPHVTKNPMTEKIEIAIFFIFLISALQRKFINDFRWIADSNSRVFRREPFL